MANAALLAAVVVAAGARVDSTADGRQTATVEGRVVDGQTGLPIAGAAVRAQVLAEVTTGRAPQPATATTDAGGRFVLRDVPPGRLQLMATAQGYVSGAYRPTSPSQAPMIRPGQRLTAVTIRLQRAAAIGGVVRNSAGAPIANVFVQIYRRGILTTRRAWLRERREIVTDSQGRYFAGDLQPGEFVVSIPVTTTTIPASVIRVLQPTSDSSVAARARQSIEDSRGPAPGAALGGERDAVLIANAQAHRFLPRAAPAPDGSTRAYRTTYYERSATLDDAAIVTLAAGDERRDIDLLLEAAPARTVRGTLLAPSGEPAAFTCVRLIAAHAAERDIDYSGEAAVTVTDAEGAFTLRDVPEGDYELKAVVFRSDPGRTLPVAPPADRLVAWTARPVSIAGADVTLPAIALRPPLSISGQLLFEGAGAMTPSSQSRTTVWMATRDGGMLSPPARTAVDRDGRFVLRGAAAGRYHLWGGDVGGWSVRSVTAGGRDITSAPLELRDADVDDVVIVLTNAPLAISGRVTDERKKFVDGAHVVMFPADYRRWIADGQSIRTMRSLRSAGGGVFATSGLPPGAYAIAAVADGDSAGWPDPRVVEEIARQAQTVFVAPGAPVRVALTVQRLAR